MASISNHRLLSGTPGNPVPFVQSPHTSRTFAPEGIVLHDTAGRLKPFSATLNWFADPSAKASAHFTVDRAGGVGQSALTNQCAWHAGKSQYKGRKSVSRFTFGIEMVNPGRMEVVNDFTGKAWYGQKFKSSDEYDVSYVETPEHGAGMWMDYTDTQIDSVVTLCRTLVKEFDLDFITTHWAISPGRKVDPNPLFPLQHVRDTVFGRVEPPVDAVEKFGDATTIVDANVRPWPHRTSEPTGLAKFGTRVDVIRSGVWNDPNFGQEQWHLCRCEDGSEGWIFALLIDMD